MTQKILAFHAGLDKVSPGQLISAKLDIVLGNDITTPVAVNEFNKAGFDKVFDKDKVAIVLDHFVPNKDIKAAQQSKQCREFACEHCVSHFYDVVISDAHTHCRRFLAGYIPLTDMTTSHCHLFIAVARYQVFAFNLHI